MSDTPNITRDFPDFLTDEALHEAYELEIQSQNGDPIRFGELVAGKGDSITSIVIFVRHFFCAYDQDYVRLLADQITQNVLGTIPENAKPAQVIIIGCGDHSLIVPYMEETTSSLPVYSDPSGKIYEKLQMKKVRNGFPFPPPPPYSGESFGSAFLKALKQKWKNGWNAFRGGNEDQQGGEWIFQRGKLVYAHRMEWSNDHLTADRLVGILMEDQRNERESTDGVKGKKSELNGGAHNGVQIV